MGRRGLHGDDAADLRAFLLLPHWAIWGNRHSWKNRIETLEASGVPWTYCRTNAEVRAYLDRFPGARALFELDIERGKHEAEAVISGRRPR